MTRLRELTDADIAALSGTIAKLRPHGARRWDPAGVRAAFAKAAHLNAADVIMAALRLSQDRTAETPGQIAITSSECWRERIADPTATKAEYCRDHGTALRGGICPSCRADQLGADGPAPAARPHRGLPPDQIHELVDEIRDHSRGAQTE